MEEPLHERLVRLVRAEWERIDPHGHVRGRPHGQAMADLTIVSALFTNRSANEREQAFWPVLQRIPEQDRVRMTYCLLLSTDEADTYYTDNEDRPT